MRCQYQLEGLTVRGAIGAGGEPRRLAGCRRTSAARITVPRTRGRHRPDIEHEMPVRQDKLGKNSRRLYGADPLLNIRERVEDYQPALLPL